MQRMRFKSYSSEKEVGASTEKLHRLIDSYLDRLKYPPDVDDPNNPRYRAKMVASEELTNIINQYPGSSINITLDGDYRKFFMLFRYAKVDDFDNHSRAIRVKTRIKKSTGKQVLKGIQEKQAKSGAINAGVGNFFIINYSDEFEKRPYFMRGSEGTQVRIVIYRNFSKKCNIA